MKTVHKDFEIKVLRSRFAYMRHKLAMVSLAGACSCCCSGGCCCCTSSCCW